MKAISAAPAIKPLFLFNHVSDLERRRLGAGNVHGANGWLDVLMPVVERYKEWHVVLYFSGDAALAASDIYKHLKKGHAVCHPH